ncbi:MAG TPA: hypothetical protein VFE78_09860 [Gemmataceae bacterium]|nr:hypothetical protein [Gemmataceae bacterium]
MTRRTGVALCAVALLLGAALSARACSLCNGNLQQAPTFRQEAVSPNARLVLVGTIRNPRLNGDGSGTSELHLDAVLRPDPVLKDRKVVVLKRYLPVSDPRNPPRFLVFCDVFKGELDPFRGVPLKTADAVNYVKKAVALPQRDTAGNLAFFFNYLEHPDPEVARDAFLEFAKATDPDIGQAARKFAPDKLRRWLKDPQTPPERLSVYALMLGACGGADDAALLGSLLKESGERVVNAYDGILGGYIHLRPREGWEVALTTLRDGRKPLPMRLAVARTLRFYHGWQPKESLSNVLKGLEAMIAQGELADVAVEDLRRFQLWDLTREVLGLYGKPGYNAPLMQRAIVRYALSAKEDAATRGFLAERRRAEPDLVKEVEESLEFEKQK